MEKSSCNAVSTKELFQVETWGSGLCGHLPIELSRMRADSRSRVRLGLDSSLQLRTFPKRDAAESRQHLQLPEHQSLTDGTIVSVSVAVPRSICLAH